jgi:hypothetical protein
MTVASRTVLLAAIAAGMLAPFASAAAQWTDRGEYDLVLMIRSEGSPQKRLDLIDAWRKQYPKSQLAENRRELALTTYQSMRDWPHMLAVAREINSAEPANPVGLYWCASLIPGSSGVSPETIAIAEKTAKALIAGGPALFSPEKKPSGITDGEWKASRASSVVIARRALGWAAWQQKEIAKAADEFTAALKEDPKNAEMSAWLGIVLSLDKNKPAQAIWSLTRAGASREEGALPDDQRMEVAQTAERAYVAWHGSTEGIDALRQKAIASPLPPADFTIETASSVTLRNLEEQNRPTNPELADWFHIRRMLEDPAGDQFFKTIQSQPLPKLKGIVIRCSPETRPEQVTLGIRDGSTEEIVLKFEAPMHFAADPGTEIEFTGAPESFHASPFQLVVTADAKNVEGWPTRPGAKKH